MARTPRKYFADEQRLAQWSCFDLTTHRVIKDDSVTGTSQTILLRAVTGTSVTWTHQPMYLVLAAVAGLATQISNRPPQLWTVGCVITVALLVAAYYKSRTLRVVISAPGVELKQELTDSASRTPARQFVDLVDQVSTLAARFPERLPAITEASDDSGWAGTRPHESRAADGRG